MRERVGDAVTADEWRHRAEREAAAIIAEAIPNTSLGNYSTVVTLVAIGWMQGCNFGHHETLTIMEETFDQMRAEL